MDSRVNIEVAAEQAAERMRAAARHRRIDEAAPRGRFHRSATISLRLAGADDAASIQRLAALDSSHVPAGEVLIAELDGHAVAAISVDDGHMVATPMVATSDVQALLRLRSAHLARRSRPWLHRFRLRAA
jgi:hypothetical protein